MPHSSTHAIGAPPGLSPLPGSPPLIILTAPGQQGHHTSKGSVSSAKTKSQSKSVTEDHPYEAFDIDSENSHEHSRCGDTDSTEEIIMVHTVSDVPPYPHTISDNDRNACLPLLSHRILGINQQAPQIYSVARDAPSADQTALYLSYLETKTTILEKRVISSKLVTSCLAYVWDKISAAFTVPPDPVETVIQKGSTDKVIRIRIASLGKATPASTGATCLAELRPYGGSANGLSLSSGDVDATLLIKDLNRAERHAARFFHDRLVRERQGVGSASHAKDGAARLPLDENTSTQHPALHHYAETLQAYAKYAEAMDVDPLHDDAYFNRIRLQATTILARLAAEFDEMEISDLIIRSRIPVLKIMLKYDPASNRVISAAETKRKVAEGVLGTYYDDFASTTTVVFLDKDSKPMPRPKAADRRPEKKRTGYARVCVDICLNNHLALRNTRLISEYCSIDPRVRQLILLVKEWCRKRENGNAFQGFLSSYGYVLLVIFYLQNLEPPLLPILQRVAPAYSEDGFLFGYSVASVPGEEAAALQRSVRRACAGNVKSMHFRSVLTTGARELCDAPCTASLAELFCGFFRFYGYQFDFGRNIVSIRLGRALSRGEKGWHTLYDYEGRERGDLYADSVPRGDSPPPRVSSPEGYPCDDGAAPPSTSDEGPSDNDNTNVVNASALTDSKNFNIVHDSAFSCYSDRHLNQNFIVCIEDPFETDINVGKSVSHCNARTFFREFRRGYCLLRRRQRPVDWLFLGSMTDPPGGRIDKAPLHLLMEEDNKHRSKIEIESLSAKAAPLAFSSAPVDK